MKIPLGLGVFLLLSLVGVVATGAQSATTAGASATQASIADVAGGSSASMQPGDTHVRIVRLSEVRGEVGMDRQTGQGFEPTMQNMPIVEGMKLATKAGTAEVEFEDGGTARAASDTVIEFPLLVRRSAGETASTIKLVQGTMYVNLTGVKGNAFTVEAGSHSVTVDSSTHLRLEMTGPKVMVAVFAGSARVQTATGEMLVGKKQTLILGDAGDVQQVKNVERAQYDAWDKESNDYHDRYTRGNAFASSGFGASDLNYYGGFSGAGGCGLMWQPYFASVGWNPYMSGAWAYYPGAGYSWVSAYPWGWLPFHSGQWSFCPTQGWGWQPGGSFVGLQNVASLAGATKGRLPTRPMPTRPPAAGESTIVVAQQSGVAASRVNAQGLFEFRNDSAGLGVPRGSLGSLSKISNNVAKNGSMTMAIYAEPAAQGRGAAMIQGPVVLRPSAAPTSGASTFQNSLPSSVSGASSSTAASASSIGRVGGGVATGGGSPGAHAGK